MKKKILWSDFLNPERKIAIQCETEQDANELLKQAHKHGQKWIGGYSLILFNEWVYYKKQTCYKKSLNGFVIASYGYYKKNGYEVYKYSEIQLVDNLDTITVEIEWTQEEFKKAVELTDKLILELHHDGYSPVFYRFDDEVKLNLSYGVPCKEMSNTVKLIKHDNERKDITCCVAICKLSNTTIPDFIKNKAGVAL